MNMLKEMQEKIADMDFRGVAMAAAGDELLRAQAHVWNHIFNFVNSMALKCAIQLGIPDAISSHGIQPMTLSELVSALRIDTTKTQCIYRLMRKLVQSGFFLMKKVNEEEEGYVLTDSSRLLLKDSPWNFIPLVLSQLDPVFTEPWHFLSAWFQSESSTPFETAHGVKLWEHMSRDPKLSDTFNQAMSDDSRLAANILLDKNKGLFEGLGSLVDVGGGTGGMAKAIAKEFPQMECTVFDLPHVVADLKGSENLKYLAGDVLLDEVPPADAVLLKWVLHIWDDEECVKILRKCREAITSNGKKKGKVMIIEMVVGTQSRDIDKSIETQLFFDMLMMTMVSGRERDEREWAKLFHDAQFSDYKISPILGLRSLIEVYP